MKVSYYPGCSLEHSTRDYEESIEAVAGLLDVQLEEVPDWNCCGATADPDDCARCLNCLRACPMGCRSSTTN